MVKRLEGTVKTDPKVALGEIVDCRKLLAHYAKEAKDVYDTHHKFILGAPRDGSAGICATIGLRAKDAAYEPVKTAMTKMLLAHTKQFKATEAAWQDDLKIRIDLLNSKLDTLVSLANGSGKEMTAFAKQFQTDSNAHLMKFASGLAEIKESMAETAIQKISADPKSWCGNDPKIQGDQYRIFEDRVALIDKILVQFDKNYNRVLKNVPVEVRGKMMFARGLTTFEIDNLKVVTAFRGAQAKFKMAVATIKKNYPKLG